MFMPKMVRGDDAGAGEARVVVAAPWMDAIDQWADDAAKRLVELSTEAGTRLPLGHAEERLFCAIAARLEASGVSRKVAADMHGLALRSYQKKLRRCTRGNDPRSLWTEALTFVARERKVTRARLETRFRRDDRVVLGAVLFDLRRSGLLEAMSNEAEPTVRLTPRGERLVRVLGVGG